MARKSDRRNQIYFGVIASRRARILKTDAAWHDRIHVEEVDSLASRWVDFHERGRPLMLGRGPSANASQHFADEHREPAELSERFARDAAQWFDEQARTRGDALLPVFAEGRTLGYLRKAIEAIDGRVVVLHGNLSPLLPSELAKHHLVVELVRTGVRGARELPPPPVELALRTGREHGEESDR